jgi:hypothetical protein
MNKNQMIILVSLIFCCNNIFSQSEQYYYFYTPEQIEYNINNSRHDACNVLYINEQNGIFAIGKVTEFDAVSGIYPRVVEAVSIGKIKHKNNNIICRVNHGECLSKKYGKTYIFNKTDKYAVETMNHTAVFSKGTNLYLHFQDDGKGNTFFAFYEPVDLITSDYWKTGIRNGVFMIEKSPRTTLIYYENNIAIDSVRYNFNDSTTFATRDRFLERYYNKK